MRTPVQIRVIQQHTGIKINPSEFLLRQRRVGGNLYSGYWCAGRGTPAGAPVPTVKISTNSALAQKKFGWIDFDAGVLLNNPDLNGCAQALFRYVIQVAEGAQTSNEKNGYREISIFKDGIIL